MAKTSAKVHKAFTLIEMTVVITILALFAAAIVPNLVSEKKAREARQFFSKARNLMLEARSRSIGDGVTRSVRLDETAGRLVVETTNGDTQEATEDRGLALPEGVTATAFRVEKQDSNSAEWRISYYADGRARGGAISFSNNGRIISLIMEDTGLVRQIDGELPALSDDEWDAGGYEQRI